MTSRIVLVCNVHSQRMLLLMQRRRPNCTNKCCQKFIQKNPRVRKMFVRNSGAGNGLRQFYGRLEKCVRPAGKAMSIRFLVLVGGGGYFGCVGGGGGGSADFIFMGVRIFLIHSVL